MTWTLVLGYLLIFLARVTDVTLGTLRMLLLVRGQRLVAAFIGFWEVIIYIFALKAVVGQLDQPFSLFFYALGFATGNMAGSLVEAKLAIGYLTVQVITLSRPIELTMKLREEGFGVTVWEGEGREGKHHILNIILCRKHLAKLLDIINNWDEKAFITVFDNRSIQGGFIRRKGK
ncbi:DUF2179 domain-containing protein [Calderihabitans maritimus]|uniref:UPF0316 protein KKC1_04330 n=1 Tax=Calderihabitans maritimus TaxID=1246530 RepID=A0A1Z5HPM2_9FIRM|nr:DUF2179 domain-containing protein [Calderihabitans maritimus]GAW91271.1 hypothetical protein Toce_1785 [Calderihabitans maritimus]